MNRIYPKDLYELELKKIQGKKYCPNCYSLNILTNRTHYPYIESNERGVIYCRCCNIDFDINLLLTKEEVRDKKIKDVLNSKSE